MFYGVGLNFPKTKVVKFHEVLHGVQINDNYRWLEEDNSKERESWIKKQNKFTANFIGKIKAKRELGNAFKKMFDLEDFGPVRQRRLKNGKWRYFQNRRQPKQDFSVMYYHDGSKGKLQVAFNPNKELKKGLEHLYWAIPSPDGSKLAYAISERGGDRASIHIKDLDSNKTLPDLIPPLRYVGISWLDDSSGFYYDKWLENTKEDISKNSTVYFHKLGTKYSQDSSIFGKGMKGNKHVGINLSKDDKYLLITVSAGWNSSEIYYKDLSKNQAPKRIVSGRNANFTPLQIINDQLYILTNYKAINGRIIKIDLSLPSEKNWTELIAESSNVIEGAFIADSKLVLNYLKDVSSKIHIHSLNGKYECKIPLPQTGTASLIGNLESKDLSILFSSFIVPPTLYKYDLRSRKLSLLEQSKQKVDFSAFKTKQVWYPSKDGTQIPMYITSKKRISYNGQNPCMIEAYGGFAASMLPYFNPWIIPFLQRGGVYAVPSLRGGNEYGKKWHEMGKSSNKQNTFDDMFGAAKWLFSSKYTNPQKLGIMGASNGGLLVAACFIQHPEMFKAILCGVPLTDMLRFHKFGGGKLWTEEYGDPEKKDEFRYLLKYSPYHNIKKEQNYPSTLITTSDNDTRTGPMHAFKFAAALQSSKKQQNPILLRVEKNAGHISATNPLKNRIDSSSTKWAFIFNQLDLK